MVTHFKLHEKQATDVYVQPHFCANFKIKSTHEFLFQEYLKKEHKLVVRWLPHLIYKIILLISNLYLFKSCISHI